MMMEIQELMIKDSSDPSHFAFEINVGRERIRHRTTLSFNDAFFNRFGVDLEIPTLSDVDLKKWHGSGLPLRDR